MEPDCGSNGVSESVWVFIRIEMPAEDAEIRLELCRGKPQNPVELIRTDHLSGFRILFPTSDPRD